ncbi:MAG: DASS family sodium-coupled anion symporter [Candidatus Methanoperedens sp.]|jgi:sodium-dependent dicarboxylate transporter 2/3/5|nr:DASS family sodium-coupled anion symporter [Candidatus Methanoperedens sp.]PKL53806.1 MAG: anion transporter [Candidatus Methanoperedenaceae archaeon HGW-Methanoperedenaceae-1]
MVSRIRISRQEAGLVLGPLLFLIIIFSSPEGMGWSAKAVAAGTAWIACWWLTEAIPIPVTSLLPIILFPLMGALEVGKVTAEYGNQIIFLLIGGFFIAIAMEKWALHIRIALLIVRAIGTSPRKTIAGFMVATAFLSAWISNTATAMMMIPIASAAIYHASKKGEDQNFNIALMLGVAYSASIGGTATLIGTTPNLIFAGIYRTFYGTEITFLKWAYFGVPLAGLLLVVCWAYLVYVAYPPAVKPAASGMEGEIVKLGRTSSQEKRVLVVFLMTAFLWTTRVLWGKYLPLVNDSSIAIFGAFLLFLIPSGKGGTLLKWDDAVKLPWGVVLLLGGGLAIAKGFTETGLDAWVAGQLFFLKGMPYILVIMAVVILTKFLTEITSNTATATIIIPVSASLAAVIGIDPMGLMIATAMTASLAFMLPVATPPNAIVFGTGYVTIQQMARAGIWMNLLSIVIVTLFFSLW